MSSTAQPAIRVTSNTGVVFDELPITDGVEAWTDREHELTDLPDYLLGGTLFRGPFNGLPYGTIINVSSADTDLRVYVAVEVGRKNNAAGRDGGLLAQLSASNRWLAEPSAPAWSKEESSMAMFSTLAHKGEAAMVPQIVEDAVLVIAAVPIFTGSFSVAAISNTSATYECIAMMEENVVAWKDREHRFVDVPDQLLGGILFQGPYKDVPQGTTLSIRPNARARIYVILEDANNGGLDAALPARGWQKEPDAPKWHDVPTMRMYRRRCAAGSSVSLPATQGPSAVFSVVVAPDPDSLTAPVEVSCNLPEGSHVETIDFVPLKEGTSAWHDEGHKLMQVPLWMLGATLVRGAHEGPPAGAAFAVRPAAPAVVYGIVEAELHNRPGRSGGLSPEVFLAAGWERREEAPEWKPGSSLAVFARRVPAQRTVCLPPFQDDGAIFTLVVKVDVEAFDATAETGTGKEYDRATMEETAAAWSDRQAVLTWVPKFMNGGVLLRGPHLTPSGTVVHLHASNAFRAYVIVEAEYKGGAARSGGFLEALPKAGWRKEAAAPGWGDPNSTMGTYSTRVVEGMELVLPATTSEAVFCVVAVNLVSSPDRLAEELKRTFRAWDAAGKGGIRKEDFMKVLLALCPGLDATACQALLSQSDRTGSGRVAYEEFIDRLLLSSAQA